MGRRKKRDEWDAADKLKVVKEYLAGHDSFVKLGRKYQLDESSIRKWVARYKTFGENAFMIRSADLNYSAAFKEEVVKACLHGEGSYKDIAIRYKIQAATTVLQWVKRYNNHEELKDSRPEGVYRMVKNSPAGKTTPEERLSIVEYCIEHDDNYSLTAGQYNCSYARVRSRVLKYRVEGIEGLYDRRGRKKAEEELTEPERLQAENRMLKARAGKRQMEIDLLKKPEETEGR